MTTTIYLHYFSSLGLIFKKPTLLLASFSILALTSTQMAICLLLLATFFDYITGVLASYYKHLEKGEEGDVWFSSDKSKMYLVKCITYFLFILLTWGVERVFEIKTFKIEGITHLDLNITMFSIAMCVAIEFYSIFWENLPRAGMDVPKKVVSISKSIWDLFNQVKKG